MTEFAALYEGKDLLRLSVGVLALLLAGTASCPNISLPRLTRQDPARRWLDDEAN